LYQPNKKHNKHATKTSCARAELVSIGASILVDTVSGKGVFRVTVTGGGPATSVMFAKKAYLCSGDRLGSQKSFRSKQ
jgi:hypothetical protein